MTAKEYLKEIRTQEFRLRSLEEAIVVLEAKAQKVTQSWSDMPMQQGASDGIAGIIVKMVDTKRQYIADWDKLIDDRRAAEEILKLMENTTHAGLLWLYYIRCKDWTVVAEEMGFAERHIYRMHGNALQEFQTLMDDVSKCQ